MVIKKKQKVANNFPPYLVFVEMVEETERLKQIKITVRIKIRWEKYKSSGQCFNCQQFDHTAPNSYKKARCVRCTEEHETKYCPRKVTKEPRYFNCGGNHATNSSQCKKRIERRIAKGEGKILAALLKNPLMKNPSERKCQPPRMEDFQSLSFQRRQLSNLVLKREITIVEEVEKCRYLLTLGNRII